MHIGFTTMNNASGMLPAALGQALEERGFESLWIGEHNHLPATGKTPYPATGEAAPESYRHMMDLIASLASADRIPPSRRATRSIAPHHNGSESINVPSMSNSTAAKFSSEAVGRRWPAAVVTWPA